MTKEQFSLVQSVTKDTKSSSRQQKFLTAKQHAGFEIPVAGPIIASWADSDKTRLICADARFFVGLPYVH